VLPKKFRVEEKGSRKTLGLKREITPMHKSFPKVDKLKRGRKMLKNFIDKMHMERKKGRDEDERIGRDNTDKHKDEDGKINRDYGKQIKDEDERTQRMMTREEVHMIMM